MSAEDDDVSTGEGSFHPLGEEWEDEMRTQLEESDYDADLGMEMAKDAQRLVAGELSEDEFHERYHDAVIEEFGVDDRPTEEAWEQAMAETDGPDGPDFGKALAAFDGDGEVDRRDAMKKMGAGAAALGLGVWGATDDGETQAQEPPASEGGFGDHDVQWGMVIDLNKCDGCLSCVVGCHQENHTDREGGEHWMYVMTYEEPAQDGNNFLVRPCQHCTDAPCEKVCPTTARHTRADGGMVLTEYDVCIGCRYCQVACPYGVNYFQWEEPVHSEEEIKQMHPEDEYPGQHIFDQNGDRVDSRPPRGVMGKCTFCPTRQDGLSPQPRGTTACEDACAMDAIHFGDMKDPDSDPNQYLERVREERPSANELQADDASEWPDRPTDTVSTFRLLEEIGTRPNVVYVGNQPGPEAEQVEGPVTYESLGMTDKRKDTTDESTLGGGLF